jgi:RNA polymerase sigma factor (sigma-70 family)
VDSAVDTLPDVCSREYPRLVGLLALQTGDRAVAEELAQDVIVKLCQHWAKIDRPEAWLTRVALNTGNSWLRRRIAERRAYGRHGVTDEVQPAVDSDAVVAMRQAVAALPRRQRQVIACRFYEDMPVAETARVLGCAEGTVRALTHRAVQRLAADLQLSDEEVLGYA